MPVKMLGANAALAAVVTMAVAGPSAAAPVTLPLFGMITEVNDPGLTVAVSDGVMGALTYDDASVAPVGVSDLPVSSLILEFPDGLTLTEADDDFGAPILSFVDGEPSGLLMSVSGLMPFGAPTATTTSVDFVTGGGDLTFLFTESSSGATVVAGELQVVPLPAAAPLFLAGLAGLGVLVRRHGRAGRLP